MAEDVPESARGHSFARHLQPRVRGAGPGGVGKGLRGLGRLDCQVDSGFGGGDRRQGFMRHARNRQAGHRSYGFGLGGGQQSGAGAAQGRGKVQRDHGHPEAAGRSGVERNGNHHRCDGLPAQHRREDRGEESRLHSGGQGNLLDGIQDSFRMLASMRLPKRSIAATGGSNGVPAR